MVQIHRNAVNPENKFHYAEIAFGNAHILKIGVKTGAVIKVFQGSVSQLFITDSHRSGLIGIFHLHRQIINGVVGNVVHTDGPGLHRGRAVAAGDGNQLEDLDIKTLRILFGIEEIPSGSPENIP